MKSTCLLLIALVVVNAPAPTARVAAPVPVVLLSIDGLKPDYIIEADKYGLKIPNLRRLLKEGSYATGVHGVLPTVTYPSHTTMITGVSPSRHGVYYNTTFDPLNKNQTGWYWYSEDIRVETLWDAARKARLVTASVDWPATVSANVDYNIAQYWRATTEDDHKLLRALSTPGLLAEAERDCGRYPSGDDFTFESDKKRAEFISWVLVQKRPRLMTCYFGGLDTEEHSSGPYSAKTFAGLEELDAMVGRVRAAAEKAGQGRAILCVVSDHGFAKVTRELRLNVALMQAGLIESGERDHIKSWKAVSWGSGGTAAIMLKEPSDAETRRAVRKVLDDLRSHPESGILQVLDNQQSKKLGGFPDAAFVVAMKPGWVINGSISGQQVTAALETVRGAHGYLPDQPEMESSFFIAGGSIPAGNNLGKIDMRDIAPTIAGLLGLRLPNAEGKNLFASASDRPGPRATRRLN